MSRTFRVHGIVKQDSFLCMPIQRRVKWCREIMVCVPYLSLIYYALFHAVKLHKLARPTEEPLCPSVCA